MEDKEKKYLPETIIGLYIFVFFASIIYGLYHLMFEGNAKPDEWWTAGAILLTWNVIGVLVIPGVRKIVFGDRKHEMSPFSRNQYYMLIGLAMTAIFGISPRISVYFILFDSYLIYIFYVSLGGIFISLTCYFNDFHFKVDRYWLDSLSWRLFFLHFTILILTIWLGTKYEDRSRAEVIIACQVFFSLIGATVHIDFYYVWRGRLKLVNLPERIPKDDKPLLPNDLANPDQRSIFTVNLPESVQHVEQPVAQVDQIIPEESSTFKIKCKNCKMAYNNTDKVPRILKECGHTICEGCATEKLAELNNGQLLECPFCEAVTVVKGRANLLQKNYTILEVIDENGRTQTEL